MYREADLYINLQNTTEEFMSFCVHNHQCDHVISARGGLQNVTGMNQQGGVYQPTSAILTIFIYFI